MTETKERTVTDEPLVLYGAGSEDNLVAAMLVKRRYPRTTIEAIDPPGPEAINWPGTEDWPDVVWIVGCSGWVPDNTGERVIVTVDASPSVSSASLNTWRRLYPCERCDDPDECDHDRIPRWLVRLDAAVTGIADDGSSDGQSSRQAWAWMRYELSRDPEKLLGQLESTGYVPVCAFSVGEVLLEWEKDKDARDAQTWYAQRVREAVENEAAEVQKELDEVREERDELLSGSTKSIPERRPSVLVLYRKDSPDAHVAALMVEKVCPEAELRGCDPPGPDGWTREESENWQMTVWIIDLGYEPGDVGRGGRRVFLVNSDPSASASIQVWKLLHEGQTVPWWITTFDRTVIGSHVPRTMRAWLNDRFEVLGVPGAVAFLSETSTPPSDWSVVGSAIVRTKTRMSRAHQAAMKKILDVHERKVRHDERRRAVLQIEMEGGVTGASKTSRMVTRTEDVASDVEVFGDPDAWQLLCKAQLYGQWMKSTKAMEVPGGVVIQVSTEKFGTVAEALVFVPGVRLSGEHGSKRIVGSGSIDREEHERC